MSKKFFATLIVAVVATFAGYNIYQSQRTVTMSDLALANVEALAGCEIDGWIGNPSYRIFFITPCSWNCEQGGVLQCPI